MIKIITYSYERNKIICDYRISIKFLTTYLNALLNVPNATSLVSISS